MCIISEGKWMSMLMMKFSSIDITFGKYKFSIDPLSFKNKIPNLILIIILNFIRIIYQMDSHSKDANKYLKNIQTNLPKDVCLLNWFHYSTSQFFCNIWSLKNSDHWFLSSYLLTNLIVRDYIPFPTLSFLGLFHLCEFIFV